MESIAERFSYRRTGSSKEHKEHRLSKANIGNPIKIDGNGKSSDTSDTGAESSAGPSMVMKCVVIQKDGKGYGLTVSGDNPVYVQSVKDDGAAAKVGVVQGDKILRVNGRSVKDLNHVEVVKLIKGDDYVALTLLRSSPTATAKNAPSSDAASNSNQKENNSTQISKQHAFYDQKVETIKKMLEQEKAEVERIKEEYAKNPEERMLKELGTAQKLKQDLEKQLWKAESMRQLNQDNSTTAPPSANVTDVDFGFRSNSEEQVSLIDMECSPDGAGDPRVTSNDSVRQQRSQTLHEVPLGNQGEPVKNNSNMGVGEESSNADLLNEFNPNPFASFGDKSKATAQPSNISIMDFEDDDIVAMCDALDHGPFNDLEKLRQRPAHLAVFFNYVIASSDPSNLLLTMAVDNFKQLTSGKDMAKQGDVIYKTYLAANAPLKVTVDEGIAPSIQSALSVKNPAEETLRGIFDPAVQVANREIRNQLSLYRMKREQGFGIMYGDDKLQQAINTDNQSDAKLVEEIILPRLSELQQSNPTEEIDQIRLNLKLEAAQGFLNQYGTKRSKSKPSSRMFSILRNKPQPMQRGSRISGSMDSIIDDTGYKKSGGISGIFNVGKRAKRIDSNPAGKVKGEQGANSTKRDKSNKQSIREQPFMSQVPLKPVKVGTSASAEQLSGIGTAQEPDASGVSHKRLDRASESLPPNHMFKESFRRPNSMPPDDGMTTEINPASNNAPPQIYEPPVNDVDAYDSPFRSQENEMEPGLDGKDSLQVDRRSKPSRSGSFRRKRDDEKRGSGSHKSHSDPDKNKVEQAIQYNSPGDAFDSRPHTLSTTDSTMSLGVPDDRKYIEQLPTFKEDSEIDIDASEQHWSENVPRSLVRDLDKKEVKRQQVINELIYTEQHHVRDLKILEKLFYEPLFDDKLLTTDELEQAFPNLKSVLELHRDLNRSLQEIKEQDGHVVRAIGDTLLSRFDGDRGNTFKEECAVYCGNQSRVLSLIKEKSKKDPKFHQFLQAAQKHPVCRKLHLKDFVPMEFQRLTKYPLLIDNIIKNTKKKQEDEIEKLKKTCERCRDILAFVNQAVKEAEDKQKIMEIQQNLDREPVLKMRNASAEIQEFKNIDLTERPIINQGPLTWRIGQTDKRKEIALHCILYDDVLVLLQKQDDRYILKCQGTQVDKASGGSHSPFLVMRDIFVRNVATDKKAFFVMTMVDTGYQMYEFAATSISVTKQWMQLITDTSKRKDALPATIHRRKGFVVPGSSKDVDDNDIDAELNKRLPAGELIGRGEENHPPSMPTIDDEEGYAASNLPLASSSVLLDSMAILQQQIVDALKLKRKYVAEICGLDEDGLESVLDLSAADREPEPGDIVKHCILCVDKLTGLLNDSAIPKNVFVKSSVESNHDPSTSNYLTVETTETGYQSDSGPTSPPEKWAIPVHHPSHSNSEEPPFSPESTTTLNSVSDLPLSETANNPFLDDEQSPYSPSPNDVIDDVDRAQMYENAKLLASERPSQNTELIDSTKRDAELNYVPTSPTINSPVAVAKSTSDQGKPSSQSGTDLLVQAGVIPVNKVMEIVITLQTQLTKLEHLAEKDKNDRQQLVGENQQLREEIQKLQNECIENSPPSYDEALEGR